MRRFALIFCLLCATGCSDNSPASPGPVEREVVLAPGELAAVRPNLTVRFIGVTGDSRCPADAVCIQGGDAVVRIAIRGEGTAERELHTGKMEPVVFEGVRIELVQLDPYPFSASPIEPDDYRATLRFQRAT